MFKAIWHFIKGLWSLKWVKWVLIGIAAIVFASVSIGAGVNRSHYNKIKAYSAHQDSVIMVLRDSLKHKSQPIYNYEIHLAVTDKSVMQCKNTGRGTLNTPSMKTYILKVDSSSVAVRTEDPYKK